MRILHLATDAFGGRGGIALYNRDLITAVAAHPRVSEIVAIPRHLPDAPGPLPEKVRYRVEGTAGKPAYSKTVLRELYRDRGFDLVVCTHLNLLPMARLASLWSGAALLLVIHGIEAWKPGGPFKRLLLRGVSATAAISRHTRERFERWSRAHGRSYLLPNAIRPELYGPGPKNPRLIDRYGLQGKRVILTVGRLHSMERYKGFDEILELLPSLPDDVTYLIVGEGDDRARLEAKSAALGMQNRVRYSGYVAEAEKADHYRLADAYVMPSRGEGFGFVFLEALACGLPVVASTLDGGREAVLEGKIGTLVDPDDREALRRAILEALARPKRIPPELEYFSFHNFQMRCHRIVDELTPGDHA